MKFNSSIFFFPLNGYISRTSSRTRAIARKIDKAFGPLLSVVRINYVKHVPKDSHNQKEFFFSFFGCEPSSKIKNHGGP